jgi:phenylpropionate dioxygenase-like ring-hydroxylating dioxygenase large terminal subunit
VLKAEDNEILTRVGPGTLMGDLLRRYWTPACLSAEVAGPGGAPARVRLLGESLVAFRDAGGRVGLVQENCPHRGASLYFGRNEGAVLRCVYHGWAFDADGRCADMPSEPAPFCGKVRMRAYPVHESGGIVWAYLGPRETMTPFRDFGTDGRDAGELIASKQHAACNWAQAMEGNLDTAHISHLHQWEGIDDIPDDGSDKPGYPSNAMSWKFWRHDRAPRLELEETWYGYRYAGIRTTPNGHAHVRVTAYALPYSTMVASIPFSAGQGLFVPIDDENCWRYFVAPRARPNPRGLGGASLFSVAPFTTPATGGQASGVVPRHHTAGNDYQIDRAVQMAPGTGIFSGVSDFVSQDLMVTESMGPVYDRTQEQLGSTDKAISRMRHILITAAKGLAAGQQPPAVAASLDYRSIRGAEKILEPDEDWRLLGTDADPVVQEAFGLAWPQETSG